MDLKLAISGMLVFALNGVIILGAVVMEAAASGKSSKDRSAITGAQSFNLSSTEHQQLEKAADAGDGNAARRLAQYYGFTMNDPVKEKIWLYRAAELGNTSAQYHLAYVLIFDDKDRNLSEAKKWLAEAKSGASTDSDPSLKRMIEDLEQTLTSMQTQ